MDGSPDLGPDVPTDVGRECEDQDTVHGQDTQPGGELTIRRLQWNEQAEPRKRHGSVKVQSPQVQEQERSHEYRQVLMHLRH